ncbi:MAG TPA: hypothetical protein VGH14_07550 [Solirubrobacterales bacterium]
MLVAVANDVYPLEERLVEAALELRIGRLVDRADVVGQLQGHAEQSGVKVHLPLGGCQGLLGGCNLAVHALALFAKGTRRYVAALFGLEPQESDLLAFELVDQLGLGGPNFGDRLLTDCRQGLNRVRALRYLPPAEPHRPRRVLVLDCRLNRRRTHIGPHGAVFGAETA